ncbi:GMC oxidoreductase [Hydnum rufescens UP504]|uniref:GMC oxidoreductase n=1 Tax=Hydnum rufescens UP504 TaxID=1448309 RepID=A0A9P6DXQ8_9AGAM|nr:GMC oxidoreductase [Hydnum rufescens UP504]
MWPSSTLFVLALSCAWASLVGAGYDYVIIGAGLSGLTVGDRLSEDGTKSILVLEAGDAHLEDPKIMIPGFQGSTLGNASYDWLFTTVPQPCANNRSLIWNRGKGIGGSTAVNFMAWGRPASGEIDALQSLGNPGWGWNNLFKYIKKAEQFQHPSATYAAANNFTYDPSAHGTSGPVKNSFSVFVSDGQLPWTSALNELGIPTIFEALGGQDVGAWYTPSAIDAMTQTRSYATTAHYIPASGRPNFKVITGAFVSRIVITGPSTGASVAASGVEYYVDDALQSVKLNAGGEVIVSAGSINTPKILELSGIGDPAVLTPLGVHVKVNLPGVGNGMADKVFTGISYELRNNAVVTLDNLRDPSYVSAALAQYNADKTGLFTIGVSAFALVPLQALTDTLTSAKLIVAQALRILTGCYSPGTIKLMGQQLYRLLRPRKFGLVEFVAFPGFFTMASTPQAGKKYITFTVDLQSPFSRGSIHITSTDYKEQSAIDPRTLSQDLDLKVLLLGMKTMRKLGATGGFKDLFAAEIDPGSSYSTDDQLISYIRGNIGTEFHTCGTSAMLPRSQGGVVSPELKVYGTENIRVVDLSIMPFPITAHPQSTLYGIAEKASDIIRGITTV